MVRERVAIGRYTTLRSDPEGAQLARSVDLAAPRSQRHVPRELAQHALTLLGSTSATQRSDGDRGQFQSLEFWSIVPRQEAAMRVHEQ
jgi:hypothetical protein